MKNEFDPAKFYNASRFSKVEIDNYLNNSKAEKELHLKNGGYEVKNYYE